MGQKFVQFIREQPIDYLYKFTSQLFILDGENSISGGCKEVPDCCQREESKVVPVHTPSCPVKPAVSDDIFYHLIILDIMSAAHQSAVWSDVVQQFDE